MGVVWFTLMLACVPGRPCVELDPDGASFSTATDPWRLVIEPPDAVEPGVGILWMWHGQNQAASSIVENAELARVAREANVIVVAPESPDSGGVTWEVTADSRERTLFRDVNACLIEAYAADGERVHAAGFSFGAFLTTYLLMHDAPRLASAVVLSGGTDPEVMPYRSPDWPLPVLIAWGGQADVVNNTGTPIRFGEVARDLASGLVEDDHPVVVCNHDTGHRIPPDTGDILITWVQAHARNAPSPWGDVGGLPTQTGLGLLPEYCDVPRIP